MYGKGMTTRDISSHIKDIYGFGISETMVSKITNKILPTIEEWQNRPLEKIYPMVFLDAIHYNVRENNIVVKKAVYIALGYNLEGFKDILGMYPRGRPWVGENESSKYWLLVLNQLKERGLEDILIVSTDNLPGFSQAIEAVYPEGIRKLIYTTNTMENFNRQLRKVTKNKTIFPNDYALQKILYLAMVDASSKWTSRIRGWDQILSQLSILFEERF